MAHAAVTQRMIDLTAVYAGRVATFKQIDAAHVLADLLSGLRTSAAPPRPNHVDHLCQAYESSPEVEAAFKALLTEVGFVLSRTAWDRVRLRVQHPASASHDDVTDTRFSSGRFSSTLPLHRDTWASNVMAAVNLWLPLAPLPRSQHGPATVALYPDLFDVPVPNNSASWSFDDLKAHRRRGEPYPQLPVATVAGDDVCASEAPIDVDVGDVVVFSGAHLHRSLPNMAAVPRFSSEVRLVNVDDYRAGRGAANVDGNAVGSTPQWFSAVLDGTRLDKLGLL